MSYVNNISNQMSRRVFDNFDEDILGNISNAKAKFIRTIGRCEDVN